MEHRADIKNNVLIQNGMIWMFISWGGGEERDLERKKKIPADKT